MDKLILAEKLEALRRCVRRVEARRPESVAALQADAGLRLRVAHSPDA